MTRQLAALALALGMLGAWAQDANALMLAMKGYYNIPFFYPDYPGYVNPDGVGVYNDGVNGPEFYVYYGAERWIGQLSINGPSGSTMSYDQTISVSGPNKSNMDFDFVPLGQTLTVNGTTYGEGTMLLLNSGSVNYDRLYVRERGSGNYAGAAEEVYLPDLNSLVPRTGAAIGSYGGKTVIYDVDNENSVTDIRVTDISGVHDVNNRPNPTTTFDVHQGQPSIVGLRPSEIEFSHTLNRSFVLGVEAGKMAVYIGKNFTEMIDLRALAAEGGLVLDANTIDFTGLAIDDVTGDFWMLTTNGLLVNFGKPVLTIPEPSTFAMAGMGILALLAYRRRQRKTA